MPARSQPVDGGSEASRRERTYRALKDRIMKGVYGPNQRLTEMELAQELGVSRQTIGIALVRLEHEGLSGRSFDSANPHVNFRLGSARVQAVMSVSTAPVIAIRLHHRHMRYTLKDLVANGTIDQPLADFFAAAVRAKKNIMIGGETTKVQVMEKSDIRGRVASAVRKTVVSC